MSLFLQRAEKTHGVAGPGSDLFHTNYFLSRISLWFLLFFCFVFLAGAAEFESRPCLFTAAAGHCLRTPGLSTPFLWAKTLSVRPTPLCGYLQSSGPRDGQGLSRGPHGALTGSSRGRARLSRLPPRPRFWGSGTAPPSDPKPLARRRRRRPGRDRALRSLPHGSPRGPPQPSSPARPGHLRVLPARRPSPPRPPPTRPAPSPTYRPGSGGGPAAILEPRQHRAFSLAQEAQPIGHDRSGSGVAKATAWLA